MLVDGIYILYINVKFGNLYKKTKKMYYVGKIE